jgi:mannose-6-phosphate isomerase-like protein (cupin superfamily)
MPGAPSRPDGVIFRGPGSGRAYECGSMRAVFKADGDETGSRYSVSEWWLEPHSPGPGPHAHAENDEIFLVLEGTASILAGETWIEAPKGSFIRIGAGITHDFENRTGELVGLFNVFIPGGFEENMPAIVLWFAERA